MAIVSRRRFFIKWMCIFVLLWTCGSLYMYSDLDNPLAGIFSGYSRLSEERVKELMSGASESHGMILEPLAKLILPENLLSFYHLPKRISDRTYTEVTSANRDTSYPLAPDFSFHISYGERDVVIYEDYGPGCVYRIYLYPVLPRTAAELHKISAKDLSGMFLHLDVDHTDMRYPLPPLMEGTKWPFLAPINTQHHKPSSGMGLYTPMCYQEYMKISYIHNDKLPKNLFEITVNCSRNDLLCPTHIYSAVSRHKFPVTTKVGTFSRNSKESQSYDHKRLLRQGVNLLQYPELNGPNKGERCRLDCVEMCSDCVKTILYKQNSHEVISSINMRVYETATGNPVKDWTSILLTATFDSSKIPQIDRVPLGSLFGVTASLNDFKGASVGHRKSYCSYDDELLSLPTTSETAYFHFPMPFWRNAKITLTGTRFIHTSYLVCYQIHLVPNAYQQKDAGYFLVKTSNFDTDVSRYRVVLSVDNSWGHVVGLFMEVNHLKPLKNVPVSHMWAGLQSDDVIYLDGQKSASVLGTGLEDYFSFAHGFINAENTTYSFLGNYHSEPRKLDQLTWHCYRLHLLDPIVFHSSIQFIVEGTLGDSFQTPAEELSYEEYMEKKLSKSGTFSHTLLYYSRAQSGLTLTDELNIGDSNSEKEHLYRAIRSGQKQSLPDVLRLNDKRYLGACNTDDKYSKKCRQFDSDDKINFQLRVFQPNQGVILRREFYSAVGDWNEKAYIWVNSVYLGVWFIPMGSLSSEYSLRQEDYIISNDILNGKELIDISIAPQTKWRDISYQTLSIHVSA